MRIEQLKDFIEIAESSSLSAAAKKLFVTPQALSASLGKMENEAGAKLLVRGQFGIELTKEGDIFLDTAQKIIRIYEAGLSEIHARPACNLAGALVVYVNLVSRSIVLPHLFRTFNQQFPHVKIRIYTQNRHQVYQTLQESPCQEIVSFFGRMKVDGQYLDTMDTLSGIEIYPIAQGKLTVCVAASSPLAHYQSLSLKSISRHPLVLLSMEGQNDFEQLLGPYGPCQILLQTDALDAWQLTIQENDCIGLIQEELVEHLQLNSQKELKIIKIKETVICGIALMTRQSKTPIVQEVIRHFT